MLELMQMCLMSELAICMLQPAARQPYVSGETATTTTLVCMVKGADRQPATHTRFQSLRRSARELPGAPERAKNPPLRA